MISNSLSKKIIQRLETIISAPEQIKSVSKVSGGSINDSYRLETTSDTFFLKVNEAKKFPSMFRLEAKGLELLKSTDAISVPAVIDTWEDNIEQFILMEYIIPGTAGKSFYADFGKAIARMHKNTAERFGLDHNNFIGSLPQSNCQHKTWGDFFINERILPQLKMAIDSGAAGTYHLRSAERLLGKLQDILPDEKPALLHGDLWSGNYTCGPNSSPWIFDPAAYYGHREADIAMTKLFGGFGPDFYTGYNEEFPMQKGWEERVDIFNLYPLLVHVNLFGGHYLHDVEHILKRF